MSSEADDAAPELEEVEPESVVERFDTPNPFLHKLFARHDYGLVPTEALTLLREVTPDHEERVLAAIKTQHGRLDRGYLLATTKWLRWIRTFPRRDDDMWGYDFKLEYKGISLTRAVIVLASGSQFQTYKKRAKPFGQQVNIIQQAMMWDADHADQAVADAITASVPQISLTEELQKLAALHQQGVLTPEEFAAAKQKLMT